MLSIDLLYQQDSRVGNVEHSRGSILDHESHRCTTNDDDDDDEDDGGFSQTGVETIKSSSGSSVGLIALGMESCPDVGTFDADPWHPVSPYSDAVEEATKGVAALNSNDSAPTHSVKPQYDLNTLLSEIGLAKYASVFEEQDVDFEMFLTLSDNDLKEIGIK